MDADNQQRISKYSLCFFENIHGSGEDPGCMSGLQSYVFEAPGDKEAYQIASAYIKGLQDNHEKKMMLDTMLNEVKFFVTGLEEIVHDTGRMEAPRKLSLHVFPRDMIWEPRAPAQNKEIS